LLLALMFPLAAVAAGVTPEAGDAAFTKLLNPIFGDNFGAGGGGGAIDGGMASLFGTLNAAVLFIAAVVMAYTIVAGTMATAHDGSMLGKKWSSMWVPIRSAFGIGMIIPLSSGFCAAQLAVMWLVGQGVGFASMGWQKYSDEFLPSATSISMPISANAPALARQMLDAQVCVARLNKEFEGTTSGYATGAAGVTGTLATTGGTRNYGYLGGAGPADYCGKVVFEGVKPGKDGFEKDIADKIGAAHVAATLTMEAEVRELAKKIVDSPAYAESDKLREGLVAASARYMDSMRGASMQAFGDKSSFAQTQAEMNGKGFVYAGFRYISAYTGASAGAAATAAGPKASIPKHDAGGGGVGADVAASQAQTQGMLDSAWAKIKSGAQTAFEYSPAGWAKNAYEFAERHAETIDQAISGELDLSNISRTMSESIMTEVLMEINSGTNHYTSMISHGHKIMGVIGTTVATLAIVSLIAGPFASGFWTSPGGLLLTGLAAAAYTAGIGMTMIPLIPAVFWLAWLGGYMLVVLEAMIAAPLWMVAHLSPEAEGFAGKGSNGYLLLVGVVLRPILGIIALAASFSVGTVLMDIFDEIFLPLMMGSTQSTDSFMGLGVVVSLIFAYMTIKMAIIAKSFNILNALPDAVMRWVGGGAAHGGLVGGQEQIVGHLDKQDAAGAAVLSSAVRSMGQGGGRSGGKKKPDGGGAGSPFGEKTGPKGDREEAKKAVDAREASGGSSGSSGGGGSERSGGEASGAATLGDDAFSREPGSTDRSGSGGERGEAYPDDPISHEPSEEDRERAKQAVDARERLNARKPKDE
jgi:conjugal transfer/type IV secretion protein DotA/TraY